MKNRATFILFFAAFAFAGVTSAHASGFGILTPKGGDNYCLGDMIRIQWHDPNRAPVTVEVSADNGSFWIPIAHTTGADSVYVWQTLPTEKVSIWYRLRILDASDKVLATTGIFSLGTPTMLTDTLRSLVVGQHDTARFIVSVTGVPKPTIQWYKFDLDVNVWKMMFGETRDTLQFNDATPSPEDSYFYYTATNPCGKVRSDSAYLRVMTPIRLISPNGGESWEEVCSTYEIAWEPTTLPKGIPFDIYYSESGPKGLFHQLVTGLKSSPYVWTIPPTFPISKTCVFYVRARSPRWRSDTSDAVVDIHPAPAKVRVLLMPHDTTVIVGSDAAFMAKACSQTWPGILWEKSEDKGMSWVQLPDQGEKLSLRFVQKRDSGFRYRTKYVSPAGFVFSSEAVLHVTGDDGTESVADRKKELTVFVSPNPTHGIVTVSFAEQPIANVTVTVIDLLGKTVKTVSSQAEKNISVDLASLAADTYTLRIATSSGEVRSFRIVKQ